MEKTSDEELSSQIAGMTFAPTEDEKESFLYSKLKVLFNDYLLSEIQSIAAFKFIKDKFGGQTDGEHVKQWVIMKVNNRSIPRIHDKMQLG